MERCGEERRSEERYRVRRGGEERTGEERWRGVDRCRGVERRGVERRCIDGLIDLI